MPEWRIERGIGETRYVRIERGKIVEARIWLDGTVQAGAILKAQLKRTGIPAVALADGIEYLLPKGAPDVTEGATLSIEITREAIPGAEPWKRPLARFAVPGAIAAAGLSGDEIAFPAPDDVLEAAGWSDLLDEARSGIIDFPGGALRVSTTPAMTLIDVDGTLPAPQLALAGARAAARAIVRHGIGGSIGIDLPTVRGKAERQAIGEAIDAVLPPPFERTSVNGFGFVQIVRARRYPSLFELAADRAAFEARALLRRASRLTGAVTLTAHPAVIAAIAPAWIDALSRQVGGTVGLQADPTRAISGGDVQN